MNDKPEREIKIVKRDNVVIDSRIEQALKRLVDLESEMGRMAKLIREFRADLLHLKTE